MQRGVEKIIHNEKLLAIIVRQDFREPGITFFTTPSEPQQLGYMSHRAGHEIVPHIHVKKTRVIQETHETLLIVKGSLRVDFYDELNEKILCRVIGAGDLILLCAGAHGFQVLEDLEMFEVKQGPYIEQDDKVRILDASLSTND